MQYERVHQFSKEIEEAELKKFVGGKKPLHDTTAAKGYFCYPTVIDNPPDNSRIVTDEPFGK